MSKGSPAKGKRDRGAGKSGTPQPPSSKARRKQIIVGLIMGAVMGIVISLLTQFWLWLPAGLALGLASGAMIRPPSDT